MGCTSFQARMYDIPSDRAAAVRLPLAWMASSSAPLPGPRAISLPQSTRIRGRTIQSIAADGVRAARRAGAWRGTGAASRLMPRLSSHGRARREGRVGIQPVPGLNLAAGFLSGKRGLETYSTPALHTATRWNGLAAYNGTFFHLAGEYFQAKNYNNVTTVATDKADAFSICGSIIPTPAWTIFGRYDQGKPSKDLKPTLEDNFYYAGLQWRGNTALRAALLLQHHEE